MWSRKLKLSVRAGDCKQRSGVLESFFWDNCKAAPLNSRMKHKDLKRDIIDGLKYAKPIVGSKAILKSLTLNKQIPNAKLLKKSRGGGCSVHYPLGCTVLLTYSQSMHSRVSLFLLCVTER